MSRGRSIRLPPEVNRILFVRNLPYKISSQDMYDIFGKYGPVRQVRKGVSNDTKGTAFVVYEDIFDAKTAVENLNGFQVSGKYLIVLYYQPHRAQEQAAKEVEQKRQQMGSRYQG